MKKKIILFMVLIAVCLNFSACSKVYESIPVYVYALGLESDSSGVKLHVVYKSGNDNKSSENKNGKEVEKENRGESGSQAEVKTFGGKDIEKAVKKMFSEYKNIYTGTIKWYIMEKDENNKLKDDFVEFTVNSSSLPLKRKIVIKENVYEYMREYKDSLCR